MKSSKIFLQVNVPIVATVVDRGLVSCCCSSKALRLGWRGGRPRRAVSSGGSLHPGGSMFTLLGEEKREREERRKEKEEEGLIKIPLLLISMIHIN